MNCDRRYFFHVWLGIYERGTFKLHLQCLGNRCSEEEGRLPPLREEVWKTVCQEVFAEKTNAVLCSDCCPAYMKKPWPIGIVDAHHVNHSKGAV